MAARPVVIVTRRLPEQVEAILREKFDAHLRNPDSAMSPGELATALRSADAVLCTVSDRITAEMLGVANRRARILANFGVGVNHIDLAAARSAGIVVTNTPGVLTDDTADLAIALMRRPRSSRGRRCRHCSVTVMSFHCMFPPAPRLVISSMPAVFERCGAPRFSSTLHAGMSWTRVHWDARCAME